MYKHFVALAAAGMVYASAAVPLFGQDSPPNPTDPQGPAAAGADDPHKVICRTARPPTGTRVNSGRSRNKICMTRADWEQAELGAQEAARTAARNGVNLSPSENTPPVK